MATAVDSTTKGPKKPHWSEEAFDLWKEPAPHMCALCPPEIDANDWDAEPVQPRAVQFPLFVWRPHERDYYTMILDGPAVQLLDPL